MGTRKLKKCSQQTYHNRLVHVILKEHSERQVLLELHLTVWVTTSCRDVENDRAEGGREG